MYAKLSFQNIANTLLAHVTVVQNGMHVLIIYNYCKSSHGGNVCLCFKLTGALYKI